MIQYAFNAGDIVEVVKIASLYKKERELDDSFVGRIGEVEFCEWCPFGTSPYSVYFVVVFDDGEKRGMYEPELKIAEYKKQ